MKKKEYLEELKVLYKLAKENCQCEIALEILNILPYGHFLAVRSKEEMPCRVYLINTVVIKDLE